MKTTNWLPLALGALILTGCEAPPPVGGAASFRASSHELGRYDNSATPGSPAYASGMPYDPDQPAPSGRYMYQQNQTGIFGNRSSSGVIETTGPIQSYQTIGNMPVYPGMPVYVNPQQNYSPRPRYYIHPTTRQRIPLP